MVTAAPEHDSISAREEWRGDKLHVLRISAPQTFPFGGELAQTT